MKSPDIVALVEVQDNNGSADNGVTDASQSYEALIAAIVAADGPAYSYTDIAPVNGQDGGQPGGNIRVGFLYNAERVSLVEAAGGKGDSTTGVAYGDEGLTFNPGRIDPTNDAFEASRKPLAAEFDFAGERVVVIANHFNSKGGDEAPFGAVQPLPATLGSEAQRHEIAQIVHDFSASVLENNPQANLVVLGDLNDFQFSRTLEIAKGDELVNLVDELEANQRYSYIYQGNSQTLDHVLVNKTLERYAEFDIVHINADFDADHGRVSDHDPLIARLDLAKKAAEQTYDLRVLHTNDTHAHLDTAPQRISAIRDKRTNNSLLLDAGDVFSGTLYFNQYNGLADLWFMNKAGYDAATFGNHEFDEGSATLKPFVEGADFPFVGANVDFGADELMQPLVQEGIGQPGDGGNIYSAIVKRVAGENIGIFGLTTEDTKFLASPGEITFKNHKESAIEAVAMLKEAGVNKIVLLSHLGVTVDRKLAEEVAGIDIIVGGHSHTEIAVPLEVENPEGDPVLIVQTGEYGNALGQLDARFDSDGILTEWQGGLVKVSGYAADPEAAAKLAEYAAPLENLKKTVIGTSLVELDGSRANVRAKETNLGNLIADGMLARVKAFADSLDTEGVKGYVTIQNSGGIRASIDAGDITLGELLTVMPFGNNLTALKMTGAEIVSALENGVSGVGSGQGRFPQVAGMRFTFNIDRQAEVLDVTGTTVLKEGKRIVSVEVRGEDGRYRPIEPQAYYIVATNSFMANEGDFYRSMKAAKDAGRITELNLVDYEVFRAYLESLGGPASIGIEGRITQVKNPPDPGPSSTPTTTPSPSPSASPSPTPTPTSTPAPTERPDVEHGDVESHWAHEAIDKATELGIAQGYGDGTFRPDDHATRAEFAAMLGRALGLDGEASGMDFADASDIPAWARAFVAQLAEDGVIGGYEDGTFRPHGELDRTEMTVMLVRALGLKTDAADTTPFADDGAIPAWAKPYIAAAREAGLIQGTGGHNFAPDKRATRAEIVTLLLRALEWIKANPKS
ncbi:5'-nucleotidase C-terminal domain-containing protein [Paenibacillus sp. LHD-117]|uniref:5'-nucleotidase C-terminal domain-containing protein n=1 Tax=Paenibacillus sp. LHD-117 TaxID=3071412 RepID=UPI0027DFF8E1|nr:5'-nucleotidase C-terminal domain-containing protein [Paenibacillus sp. LHD-117]MDQ6423142.1 5'-nucleotidase C-terminal domain-containing protein [Paenibacillus sp. LHD-117]